MKLLAPLALLLLCSVGALAAPKKPPPKKPVVKKPTTSGKLACGTTCVALNRAIVAKTAPFALGKATTAQQCLAKAFATKGAKFVYYQWVPTRALCYGFKDCAYNKQNTAVISGVISKCPKPKFPPPPPPIPTYCSASFKGKCFRRCPRETRCEKRGGNKKVCCCPPSQPNPIIEDGRLKGCQK